MTTTTTEITAVFDDNNHHRRRHTRLYVSCFVTVALSSMILWGLVKISDPEAKLLKLALRNVDEETSIIDIELQLKNKNFFRGFNYTDIGWIDLYYLSDEGWGLMNNSDTPDDYQGFGRALNWNFSIVISAESGTSLMKTEERRVYVSLVLVYWYKILFWTTKTYYFQWLDAHAYLNNDSFDLKEAVRFNRTKDFTLVLG